MKFVLLEEIWWILYFRLCIYRVIHFTLARVMLKKAYTLFRWKRYFLSNINIEPWMKSKIFNEPNHFLYHKLIERILHQYLFRKNAQIQWWKMSDLEIKKLYVSLFTFIINFLFPNFYFLLWNVWFVETKNGALNEFSIW